MDEVAAARAAAPLVMSLGGAFMTDPGTLRRGKELGLRGWRFYFLGRAGVLGSVDPDVVRAATVFFPYRLVDRIWVEAKEAMTPEEGARHYREQLHRWARRHLRGVAELDRLADLVAKIVDTAPVAGLPLFAGWRSLGRPDDTPALAGQLLMTLRERRGGLHGIAALNAGLTPLETLVAGPGGVANAEYFGWQPPFPDVDGLAERHAAVERATDVLDARAWTQLDRGEREELVRLLQAASDTAFAKS